MHNRNGDVKEVQTEVLTVKKARLLAEDCLPKMSWFLCPKLITLTEITKCVKGGDTWSIPLNFSTARIKGATSGKNRY